MKTEYQQSDYFERDRFGNNRLKHLKKRSNFVLIENFLRCEFYCSYRSFSSLQFGFILYWARETTATTDVLFTDDSVSLSSRLLLNFDSLMWLSNEMQSECVHKSNRKSTQWNGKFERAVWHSIFCFRRDEKTRRIFRDIQQLILPESLRIKIELWRILPDFRSPSIKFDVQHFPVALRTLFAVEIFAGSAPSTEIGAHVCVCLCTRLQRLSASKSPTHRKNVVSFVRRGALLFHLLNEICQYGFSSCWVRISTLRSFTTIAAPFVFPVGHMNHRRWYWFSNFLADTEQTVHTLTIFRHFHKLNFPRLDSY